MATLVAVLMGITGVAVAVGGVAVAPPPAGAAPVGLNLEMVPGSGELLIRDAEEPYALESPTTVVGTIDGGDITDSTLSTPPISFEQPVAGGALTADVDATFTQISPGAGVLDSDGSLSLTATLRADLHIEVPEAGISADCTTSPVNLELVSTEPYSEDTGLVPVADAEFTIPPVPVTPTCDELVAGQVNASLAGPGHSIGLTLEGELALPSAGAIASATTLAVTPSGTASVGEDVTLAATVASDDPDHTEVPTGVVELFDGDTLLGQATLSGGVATLTTTALGIGDHQLSARYRGDEVYESSTSNSVALTVQADPAVTAEIPSIMNIGAPPAEFDVVADNPSVGREVTNARVDLRIARAPGSSTLDPLTPEDVLLEVRGPGDAWAPVTLTQVPDPPPGEPARTDAVTGSLGPDVGRALAAGESLTDRVRLSFPSGSPETNPGPLDVTFDLVEVDPASGEMVRSLSSTTGRLDLYRPGRIQSEIILSDFGSPGVWPSTLRPNGTIGTDVVIQPQFSSSVPTGAVTVAIDGQAVPFWAVCPGDLDQPNQMSAPITGGTISNDCDRGANELLIPLPPSVGPGTHTVTFSYSGNAQFTPTSKTVEITVVEPIGVPYECEYPNLTENRRFTTQVLAGGRLPATVPSGTSVGISDFALDIVGSMNSLSYYAFDITRRDEEEISIDLGPEGTGTATEITLDPNQINPFAPPTNSEFTVGLTDEEAAVTITGEPGTTIVPTIDQITIQSTPSGGTGPPSVVTCVPIDDPVSFGAVTVAGTTLAVDAPTPTRAGDFVTLTASTFPNTATGTVRFYDGDNLVALAPVSDGQAVAAVTLPEGERSLTARFFAGASAPSTTSEPVVVEVLPEFACSDATDEGSAAVVRLTYLELLGRCPDAAGLAFWTDQLDDGVSPEAFARSIAHTPEARGQVVDDGYQTILERDADPDGRAFWIERLRGDGRYDQLLADLAGSNEFWEEAGSTNGGFVDLVYERLLNRPSDADGRAYWVARLDGGESRRVMVRTFARLGEPLGKIVDASFDEILGRAPTTAERTAAVEALRADGDRSGLYAQLIGTQEFFDRAQELPNPEV